MRDVVIVGGGPVGTMLACVLAVGGLDVEVLEQRETPSLRSRAIGIHPPSLRALANIGVAHALIEQAVHIPRGEVWFDGKRMGQMSFERSAPGFPFVAALPQYETDKLLRERFELLRPGQYHSGMRVNTVVDCGESVRLSTDAGAIDARYVVGADGARSRVRGEAGIGWKPLGKPDTYLMGDFAAAGAADTGAVLYFERGGVVESFPLPGGRRRWVALTDFLATKADSADLAALIKHRTGVTVPEPLGEASAFTAQQRLAERMHVGRILLVGDAAHQISPIGGQGMNLGWLDAVALAPALQRALLDPAAAASVLKNYDRTRLRSARRAVVQATFNMQMGRPVRGLRLGVRNTLVRGLTLPPANELVARAFTMRWL